MLNLFLNNRVFSIRMSFNVALVFVLLARPLTLLADPQDVTAAEMKLLPRYCPDTEAYNPDRSSVRYQYWLSLLGNSFKGLHHYCWAQITMMRSQKVGISRQARQAMWESARGDYGYVLKTSTPDFVLLPEIYTRVGEVELLLAHPDKASEAFARARQLKPDYWPAYSHWAEFLISIGRRPEALKVVVSGLAQSPDAKVLLEQFRVLGGKPSDIPKPVEKPKPVIEPGPATEPAEPNNSPAPEGKPIDQ